MEKVTFNIPKKLFETWYKEKPIYDALKYYNVLDKRKAIKCIFNLSKDINLEIENIKNMVNNNLGYSICIKKDIDNLVITLN